MKAGDGVEAERRFKFSHNNRNCDTRDCGGAAVFIVALFSYASVRPSSAPAAGGGGSCCNTTAHTSLILAMSIICSVRIVT